MASADLKSKLKSPTTISVCLFICVAAIFLLLLEDLEEPEHFISTDSWTELSANRYAYNICSLLPEERTGESQSQWISLPKAHQAWKLDQEDQQGEAGSCSQQDAPELLLKSNNDSNCLNGEGDGTFQACKRLFSGEGLAPRTYTGTRDSSQSVPFSQLIQLTGNCSWVSEQFSNGFYTSEKEKSFPIAYAMNIYHSAHQIMQFLKVIYRPHNIYCLHFDQKSSHGFKQVFFNIASCLGNVIIPRRIQDVHRGWYTLVEAQHSCFSDLVLARDKFPWKYVITLCGMEVPLRTNAEIVAMLEPLNGTSSVKLVGADGLDNFKYKWKWSLNRMTGWITKKDAPLPPIPYGLKVYKSWAYVALSHKFVEYLLCSPEAITLRNYMKDVRIPEENIYAMLFMKPNTPGGYRAEHENKTFPIFSCIWMDGDHHGLWRRIQMMLHPRQFCSGSNIHNICMVGAGDLHKLSFRPGVEGYLDVDTYLETGGAVRYYDGPDRGPLFHNKFIMERDSTAMVCMERELRRRNIIEYQNEVVSK